MLAKLEKFKSVFSAKSNGSDDEPVRKKDENLSDWMGVGLKFTPEAGKVLFSFLMHHGEPIHFDSGCDYNG